MKVILGKHWKFGAHTYTLKLQRDLIARDNFAGRCLHSLNEILIDPSYIGTQRDEILLHEVLEVIDRIWNCNLPHENMDRIAEGFLMFLENLGIQLDWSEIDDETGT